MTGHSSVEPAIYTARMHDPGRPDPKQSGTPLWLYIACVGIGAVAIAAVMAVVMARK